MPRSPSSFFFFFNDTATTEIYTLSLHDALPILHFVPDQDDPWAVISRFRAAMAPEPRDDRPRDRKSTRLNSSHQIISYAVFCLKKKNTNTDDSKKKVVTSRINVKFDTGQRTETR